MVVTIEWWALEASGSDFLKRDHPQDTVIISLTFYSRAPPVHVWYFNPRLNSHVLGFMTLCDTLFDMLCML